MSEKVTYDHVDDVVVNEGLARETDTVSADGLGCHAGAEQMKVAAQAAGNSELLEQFAKDYPQGPHDKPQSMCPAFGALRVGLRMRRVATVLSGSACCVYGLTFVSHFYGARRSVGYVPFNSETLVTGKLYEDIRDCVHVMADPEKYDAIVVTNLCVPTASGVPLRLLPNEINGVRIVGIDVPGFGVPTHAEAKDVLAGAMLDYARAEVAAGPVPAPIGDKDGRPTVTLLGEMYPAATIMIGAMSYMRPLIVGALPPSILFTLRLSGVFKLPDARSLDLRPLAMMEQPHGLRVWEMFSTFQRLKLRWRRTRFYQQYQGLWQQHHSKAQSLFPATRAVNCLLRVS